MPTPRLTELSAREYKLLLDFEHFGPSASVDSANTFWKEMLIPAIASKLDRRDNGEERAEGELRQSDGANRAILGHGEPHSDRQQLRVAHEDAPRKIQGTADRDNAQASHAGHVRCWDH